MSNSSADWLSSTGPSGSPFLGSRIESLVELLSRLAAGDLTARAARSGAEDEIDAVIEGVNMLAEELEASRSELEQRVLERTAELQEMNRDVLALADLGNLLQACETLDEAYAVIDQGLSRMFDHVSGAVYLFRASRNLLERKAAWGQTSTHPDSLAPSECWALRRGTSHRVASTAPSLSCPHIADRTGDSLCVPMSAQGETIGLLLLMGQGLTSLSGGAITPAKQQLAKAAAEQTSLALANLDLRRTLQYQAVRDPLTGLHNRRFLDESLAREIARSDRSGSSLGVVMLDVDHFKQVNDVFGHEAGGDELLKAIGHALVSATRPGDLPCRYGGEEFLVLLADIDLPALGPAII